MTDLQELIDKFNKLGDTATSVEIIEHVLENITKHVNNEHGENVNHEHGENVNREHGENVNEQNERDKQINLCVALYKTFPTSYNVCFSFAKVLLCIGKYTEAKALLQYLNKFILPDRKMFEVQDEMLKICCLLYTSPSPRDGLLSRMPSSA